MELFWDSIKEAIGLILGFNRSLLDIISLSLRVSGTAVLIGLCLGIPLGTWLGLARFRGRGILANFVNTGLAMPPVVVGLLVYMLLSRSGPLGSLRLLFTPPAMVIAQVLLATPYIAAIAMAAVASVPKEFRLQAMGLGASKIQALFLVLREARVSLMTAVVAGFGSVISEVGAVMMVGGNIATSAGNKTRVMTTAIVEETRKGNFARALALGVLLVAITFLAMGVLTRQQQGARSRWLQS